MWSVVATERKLPKHGFAPWQMWPFPNDGEKFEPIIWCFTWCCLNCCFFWRFANLKEYSAIVGWVLLQGRLFLKWSSLCASAAGHARSCWIRWRGGRGVVEAISENSRVRTPLLVNLGLKFALIVWLACLFTIAFARLFVRGSPVSLVDALLWILNKRIKYQL